MIDIEELVKILADSTIDLETCAKLRELLQRSKRKYPKHDREPRTFGSLD